MSGAVQHIHLSKIVNKTSRVADGSLATDLKMTCEGLSKIFEGAVSLQEIPQIPSGFIEYHEAAQVNHLSTRGHQN
jgi:hypothetical protein